MAGEDFDYKELAKRLRATILRACIAGSAPGALLSREQVEAYINYSRSSFYRLRQGQLKDVPRFPKSQNNGCGDVWRKRDVDRWIDSLPPSSNSAHDRFDLIP